MSRDVFRMISNVIAHQLNVCKAPWSQIESNGDVDFQSANAITGKVYSGINALLLPVFRDKYQLKSFDFISFGQASKLAGITEEDISQIRSPKSELSYKSKGHPFIGVSPIGFVVNNSLTYIDKSGKVFNPSDVSKTERLKLSKQWDARTSPVWSVEQLPIEMRSKLPSHNQGGAELMNNSKINLKSLAQGLIKKEGIKLLANKSSGIEFNVDLSVDDDKISMPNITQFVSDNSFYRTVLYSAVLFIEHKNQSLGTHQKNEAYSEMVAEFTCALLCQKHGIKGFTSSNLEAVVSNQSEWVALMEDNPKVIIYVASTAQKLASYISGAIKYEHSIDEVSPSP